MAASLLISLSSVIFSGTGLSEDVYCEREQCSDMSKASLPSKGYLGIKFFFFNKQNKKIKVVLFSIKLRFTYIGPNSIWEKTPKFKKFPVSKQFVGSVELSFNRKKQLAKTGSGGQ